MSPIIWTAIMIVMFVGGFVFLRRWVTAPQRNMKKLQMIQDAWNERETIRGYIENCSAREKEQYAPRLAELNRQLRRLGVERDSLLMK